MVGRSLFFLIRACVTVGIYTYCTLFLTLQTGVDCVLCEFVMKELDKLLKENSTEVFIAIIVHVMFMVWYMYVLIHLLRLRSRLLWMMCAMFYQQHSRPT